MDECGVSGGLSDSCAVAVQAQLQMVTLSGNTSLQSLQVPFLNPFPVGFDLNPERTGPVGMGDGDFAYTSAVSVPIPHHVSSYCQNIARFVSYAKVDMQLAHQHYLVLPKNNVCVYMLCLVLCTIHWRSTSRTLSQTVASAV